MLTNNGEIIGTTKEFSGPRRSAGAQLPCHGLESSLETTWLDRLSLGCLPLLIEDYILLCEYIADMSSQVLVSHTKSGKVLIIECLSPEATITMRSCVLHAAKRFRGLAIPDARNLSTRGFDSDAA